MEPKQVDVDNLLHALDELRGLLREMTSTLIQHDKGSTQALQSMSERIDHRFVEVDRRLQRLEESVYGNGKEGLKDKVHRMEWSMRLAQWGIAIAGASMVIQIMAIVNNALFKAP